MEYDPTAWNESQKKKISGRLPSTPTAESCRYFADLSMSYAAEDRAQEENEIFMRAAIKLRAWADYLERGKGATS